MQTPYRTCVSPVKSCDSNQIIKCMHGTGLLDEGWQCVPICLCDHDRGYIRGDDGKCISIYKTLPMKWLNPKL